MNDLQKADYLRKNGWATWGHENNWIHPFAEIGTDSSHTGLTLEQAYTYELSGRRRRLQRLRQRGLDESSS